MGMYTCLKFTGELKEEFADDIKRLFHWKTADREDANYNEWEDFAKKYTFAKHFASLDRACWSANSMKKIRTLEVNK